MILDIEDDFTGDDSKANAGTPDAPDGGGSISDEEATEERADDVAHKFADKNSFNIGDIIDVDHLDLHDTLSDKLAAKPKALLTEKQGSPAASAAPKELTELDWVF